MKRIFATILLVFYLGVSSGATLQFHYCMGELIQWGVLQNNDSNCPSCGMKKKVSLDKKCCKENHQEIKTDKSRVSNNAEFNFQQFVSLVVKPYQLEQPVAQLVYLKGALPLVNAPPLEQHTSIFLLHCTFRI